MVTVLTNEVKDNTNKHVVPALLKAGLPATSLKPLLTALGAGNAKAAEAVPGVTKQILGVAVTTLKAAYAEAFKVDYLVTIAFGGISSIASFFTPSLEHLYTGDVMRRLHVGGRQSDGKDDMKEKPDVEHVEHVEEV